jgi:hypothetical protein
LGLHKEARSALNAFVRERHLELRQNGEPAPADDRELARLRADRYRRAGDRKHFIDGLRKAGLGAPTVRLK